MEETVNIAKSKKKLSKQQKAILEELSKINVHSLYISDLSWKIAERFNKENNDRIWSIKETISKEREELEKQIELGELSEQQIRNGYSYLSIGNIFNSSIHKKSNLLTAKHRASLSRSLKRLDERDLIYRIKKFHGKTTKVGLTGNYGVKACRILGYLDSMTIRIDCHNSQWHGNIKEIKKKYPNAHLEIIMRRKGHILSPSKKLLIKIGIMKNPNGTKNKKWDLSKPEVFAKFERELMIEFFENYEMVNIALQRLRKIAKEKTLFLVCSCKYAERCHRLIVKRLLETDCILSRYGYI